MVQALSEQAGDIAENIGATTGFIPRSKVGDCLVSLGPDSAAAGEKIVLEFKESAGYTIKSTLDEIETARKNRSAGVGLFVHSRRTAPEGTRELASYGNDVVVIWDAEDESTDNTIKSSADAIGDAADIGPREILK